LSKKEASVKQEKNSLESYKKTNATRLTAALKAPLCCRHIYDNERSRRYNFVQQYTLVKLIDNEEEAAKCFILREPVTNNSVDWDSIDIFHNEMEMVPEEEHLISKTTLTN
jgi:hypothetical protein